MSHLWLTQPSSKKAVSNNSSEPGHRSLKSLGCKLLPKQQPGWVRAAQSPESCSCPQPCTCCCCFSGLRWHRKTKEWWCQFLYCVCWKAPEGRKSVNKSSQVLKRAITDATLMKWSERHCREQRVTETQKGGKKGALRQTAASRNATQSRAGDAFGQTTRAREDEQHSEDIVGSQNQRKGAVTVMEMSKTILGREPTTRTVQGKATRGEDQQGTPCPRCWERNPASWGLTAGTWTAPLFCAATRASSE